MFMRKIDFRGQIINTTDWVRGNLLSYPEENLYLIEIKIGSSYIRKQVDENTIGQFIGIVDKYNEEICEGDIVLIPEGYGGDYFYKKDFGVIKYDSDGSEIGFYIETSNLSDYNWSQLEIVGNIYDDNGILKIKELM